jgi:hypothetical protein
MLMDPASLSVSITSAFISLSSLLSSILIFRMPPISKERSIALKWCLHDNEFGLGALYEDANGRRYTATCNNDLSTTKSGWRFGPWPEGANGKLWANGKVVMPAVDLR